MFIQAGACLRQPRAAHLTWVDTRMISVVLRWKSTRLQARLQVYMTTPRRDTRFTSNSEHVVS
jgi:hypothetical protein